MSQCCPGTPRRAVQHLLARAGAHLTIQQLAARGVACLVRAALLGGTIAQPVAVLFRQGWLPLLTPVPGHAAGAGV